MPAVRPDGSEQAAKLDEGSNTLHPSQVVTDGSPERQTPLYEPSSHEHAPMNTEHPKQSISEQPSSKKRKAATSVVAEESKRRGRRMFGLLQSTLKQAKADTGNLSEAAKKRQELEMKLQTKLLGERKQMMEKRDRANESRDLLVDITTKQAEIEWTDVLLRSRHAAKLDLAEFLCTSFVAAKGSISTGILKSVASTSSDLFNRVPQSLQLANSREPRPIYYMPYRLLASQEDRIDDQIAEVERIIKEENRSWEQQKKARLEEVDALRRRREENQNELHEIERRTRQSRQTDFEPRTPRRSRSRSQESDKTTARHGAGEAAYAGKADSHAIDGLKAQYQESVPTETDALMPTSTADDEVEY